MSVMQHPANESGHPQLPLPQPPEQSEMPFAIVQGEPVTRLPRDLYIPPDALEVFLEAFEGPLDLLLYLIRRQNLNILDVPIAEITRQYMQYIDLMTVIRLELAAEYLVMAAMLAEIKSRMLLPRSPTEEGEEEDPRAELVRRLQEYERYKTAAEDMDALPRAERDVHIADAEMGEHKVVRLVPEVSMQELLTGLQGCAAPCGDVQPPSCTAGTAVRAPAHGGCAGRLAGPRISRVQHPIYP